MVVEEAVELEEVVELEGAEEEVVLEEEDVEEGEVEEEVCYFINTVKQLLYSPNKIISAIVRPFALMKG